MVDSWLLLDHQHEVLDQDFCSGYVDAFGKWNTGFLCPLTNRGEQLYCCGTATWRYCCKGQVGDGAVHTNINAPVTVHEDPLLLVLGIALGAAAGLALLLLISCCLCPGCLLHSKRRTAGPPVYRLQRSSTLHERSLSSGLNTNSAWNGSLAQQQPIITPLPLSGRGPSNNVCRDHPFSLDNGRLSRAVEAENLEERLVSRTSNLSLPVNSSQASQASHLPPQYQASSLRACPIQNHPPPSYQRSIPWQPTGTDACPRYSLRAGSESSNLLVNSVAFSESDGVAAVPLHHVHRIDCMYHSSSKY